MKRVDQCSELTSGNHRVPAPPPVEENADARTVLVRKGSLRRAKPARPCALRAVLAYPVKRRAAPAGTRWRTIRRQTNLRGTSVSPLTKLIMEVPENRVTHSVSGG